MRLESVTTDDEIKNDNKYEEAFEKEITKGNSVGYKNTIDKGKAAEKEEFITATKLSSAIKYRVVL